MNTTRTTRFASLLLALALTGCVTAKDNPIASPNTGDIGSPKAGNITGINKPSSQPVTSDASGAGSGNRVPINIVGGDWAVVVAFVAVMIVLGLVGLGAVALSMRMRRKYNTQTANVVAIGKAIREMGAGKQRDKLLSLIEQHLVDHDNTDRQMLDLALAKRGVLVKRVSRFPSP